MGMNTGFISGNLARDGIELSSQDDDMCVAAFTVASDYGKEEGQVNYVQVKAFGNLADALLENTGKGSKVTFEYHVQTSSFVKDGKTQYRQDLVVNKAEF